MRNQGLQLKLDVALMGFAHFQILYSAAKLGIVPALTKAPGSTLEQIAKQLAIPPHSTRVLMLGCVALGVAEKRGPRYRNGPVAPFLDPASGVSVLGLLEAYHSILYPGLFGLHQSLRTGRNEGLGAFPGKGSTLYERLARNPGLETVFHDWMSDVRAATWETPEVLSSIRAVLGRARRLVDCGGGDGSVALRLCSAFPALHATVFDRPSLCARAEKKILLSRHLSARVGVRAGDFLADPLPRDADAFLFSHVFNIYSPRTNHRLLAKAYRALDPGGVAIAFDAVSDDAGSGPLTAAALSAYFLSVATGEGMVYSLKDHREWFKAAGFERVRMVKVLGGRQAFVIGFKPLRRHREAPSIPGTRRRTSASAAGPGRLPRRETRA